MKLILIVPGWPPGSLWSGISFRFPYLAIAQLGALTDADWQITLIDENVTSIDFKMLPDLVGISIMTPLAKRGYEIADCFREKGIPVVLGGVHPTMMREEAKAHADAVVVGEAESVWPTVLSDFRNERLKPFYQSTGFCALEGLPIPRRDLFEKKTYFFTNTLQTTRGCPFNCNFCSVTSFYGRTYRSRPVAEIIDELSHVERGFVFFVDDNITGNRRFAEELFNALIPLKIRWFSQASLDISNDKKLLDLAERSGCKGLFVGFESLSQETLKALGKSPNRVGEYKEAIEILHDHGIGIQGSFIFGADKDDLSVFSDVLRFIEKSRLEAALFSVLTPFPGTRLRDTLIREKRILHSEWEKYDMNHVVFEPKRMTVRELQDGLHWAYRKLYGYGSILKRLFPFMRNGLFFGIQNYGFRQAWMNTLRIAP
jgi:radical SAM superfamily enzyme YgiQ (UPF0313 family)